LYQPLNGHGSTMCLYQGLLPNCRIAIPLLTITDLMEDKGLQFCNG